MLFVIFVSSLCVLPSDFKFQFQIRTVFSLCSSDFEFRFLILTIFDVVLELEQMSLVIFVSSLNVLPSEFELILC